ncbi:piRNA biogenesis protein EXD1 [Gastrophryne carolinensis]
MFHVKQGGLSLSSKPGDCAALFVFTHHHHLNKEWLQHSLNVIRALKYYLAATWEVLKVDVLFVIPEKLRRCLAVMQRSCKPTPARTHFADTAIMDTDGEKSFLSMIIGKPIKITTTSGCFQGILLNVDDNRTLTLMRVEPAEEDVTQEAKVLSECGPLLSQKMAPNSSQEATAKLLRSLKRAVEDQDVLYTVVDQFQPLFGPAIGHLKSQKVVGVSAVGLNISRHGKLSWLQMATPKHVYLFDILTMGPGVFKNGLQGLLEDKDILKVTHDCRCLADILTHQYSVVLSNVFDTQVGDMYLFTMETGGFLPHRTSSLKKCLTRHLNLPATQVEFCTLKEALVKDNPNIWLDRPVPPALLKVLALDVKYILNLRLVMLDAMLLDFTMLVDSYLNTYRQGAGEALGSAEMSSSELPKELKQLLVLQEMRREKALKQYNVSSQGLLIREVE